MEIRGEEDQRLIPRFEGREATDAWQVNTKLLANSYFSL